MKHITSFALALILTLSAVSCGGGEAEPAGTTAAESTTADTTAVVTDATAHETVPETTVMTTVETTTSETTEVTTAEAEPDFTVPAGFLSDYTVYDVTYAHSYTALLDELKNSEDANKPEKVALRFTDLNGLTAIADVNGYKAVGLIYGDSFVSCEPAISLSEHELLIKSADGIISVCDLKTRFGFDSSKNAYLFSDSGYVVIPVCRKVDESNTLALELWKLNGKLYYSYYQVSLHYAVAIGGIMQEHLTSDDIYCETGAVVLRDGIPVLEKTHQETVGEWYVSTGFSAKQFRDKYQIPTYDDMLEWYITDNEGFMEAFMSNLKDD